MFIVLVCCALIVGLHVLDVHSHFLLLYLLSGICPILHCASPAVAYQLRCLAIENARLLLPFLTQQTTMAANPVTTLDEKTFYDTPAGITSGSTLVPRGDQK